MEYKENIWNGYKTLEFIFKGKNAILVIPENPREDKKWLFKTEYFGAFPQFELEMLSRGFYLANIQNTTRWCLDEDTERQAEFARFLNSEFGLCEKCVPVGMSCGGMQAVYLAGKYPQIVSALYIDAPVLNLLSCPCAVGGSDASMYEEFVLATGKTVKDMINYRNHPIDYVDKIIENKIPVFLVCGDSDKTVHYDENGNILYEKMKKAGADIEFVLKKGCDHHPHGLEDNKPLIDFVLKKY